MERGSDPFRKVKNVLRTIQRPDQVESTEFTQQHRGHQPKRREKIPAADPRPGPASRQTFPRYSSTINFVGGHQHGQNAFSQQQQDGRQHSQSQKPGDVQQPSTSGPHYNLYHSNSFPDQTFEAYSGNNNAEFQAQPSVPHSNGSNLASQAPSLNTYPSSDNSQSQKPGNVQQPSTSGPHYNLYHSNSFPDHTFGAYSGNNNAEFQAQPSVPHSSGSNLASQAPSLNTYPSSDNQGIQAQIPIPYHGVNNPGFQAQEYYHQNHSASQYRQYDQPRPQSQSQGHYPSARPSWQPGSGSPETCVHGVIVNQTCYKCPYERSIGSYS